MGMCNKDWVNETTIRCNCGCGELQFTSWKDDGFATFSYNLPAFYAYQRPWLGRFKEGISIIWAVISNKQHRLFEVVLFEEDNEQIRNFKEFAEGIKEFKGNTKLKE